MNTWWMSLISALAVLLTTINGYCETLTFISSIPLSAPMLSGYRASADGTRVVIHLRERSPHTPGLQIIDTSDIQHPKQSGFFPLPNYGLQLLPSYEDVALSSDGKFALLAFAKGKEEFRKETAHEIIALDLTEAGSPKELWRKEIFARQVRLSADAGAYAYSNLSAVKKMAWETTVVFVKQDRRPLILPEGEYSFGDMRLSVHAKFLAFNDGAELRAWELSSIPPKLYEQEFPGGRQRFGCLAGVLESGHIVVNDYRFTRLGIYNISPRMPRISTLTYEGVEYCDSISPASASDRLYYHVGQAIDFHIPNAPTAGNIWSTSDDIYPIAVANNLLFAYLVTSVNNTELRVYRINSAQPTASVWQTLDNRYSAIMESYITDLRSGKSAPHVEAIKRFEEAGVLKALDVPVVDIPLQRAAAILNDYGFLANKMNSGPSAIEHIYRRVIDLDPSRKVAYLNLADLLKDSLRENKNTRNNQDILIAEIKKYYRNYLRLGGKQTASLKEFLKDDPALKILSNACAGIAAYAKAGLLDELMVDKVPNVLISGKRVDLIITADDDGSAIFNTFDATNDFPITDEPLSDFLPETIDGALASQFGLLTFGSETYLIYYDAPAHPVTGIALSDLRTCMF